MIATAEPNAETTKQTRTRKTRNAGAQATVIGRAAKTAARKAAKRDGVYVTKSKDPSLVKSSFYLPAETADKLVVASILRGKEMSDVVAEILARELSSIAYYDKTKAPTPPTDSTLTVEKIDSDVTD